MQPTHFTEVSLNPGDRINTEIEISESYSSRAITIPIHIRRGLHDGPKLFVTAALHGDEINGTGAIRELLADETWELRAGTLILVPVLNILGYERHSRYLPDRRDLNRCYPGSESGSMSSRMARSIFEKLIKPCNFGIDLHTAAVRRTNYPNVRADLDNANCRELAEVFGAGLIMDCAGPIGALRRAATNAGVPTIVVEGGEVWKMETGVIQVMHRGVMNVLRHLKMVEGQVDAPGNQTIVRNTKWVRAERGGLMQMHVAPGDVVTKGQPLASNYSLLNETQNQLFAPCSVVVLGVTTLPAVKPGEPVVHIGKLGSRKKAAEHGSQTKQDSVQQAALEALATSVHVTEGARTAKTDR